MHKYNHSILILGEEYEKNNEKDKISFVVINTIY